jgi:hypothetical protein
MIYLIKFYNKKEFIFHNLGFTIYFVFLAKKTLKLFGLEIIAFADADQYISIFSQFFLIAMFSSANIQQYRSNKKRKFEMQL